MTTELINRIPYDWKPIKGLGAGVREIRIRDKAGAFRLVHIATFAEAVYVLHVFQKKTPRTSPHDIWLAKSRLSELKRGMNR